MFCDNTLSTHLKSVEEVLKTGIITDNLAI